MANKAIIMQGGDGTEIPAGMVGGTVAGSATITCTNKATWYVSSTIGTLTAGIWVYFIRIRTPAPSATANALLAYVSYSTTPGADAVTASIESITPSETTIANRSTFSIQGVVSISTATPLYLQAYSEDVDGAAPGVAATFVRIA